MIFFGVTKNAKTRVDKLNKFKETASANRSEIEKKLKDTKILDQELSQLILDTKALAKTVNKKLTSRLKISSKTLKSVCYGLKDGVIIVDHNGIIIEANAAFEKIFLVPREEVISANLGELCVRLDALKDGCKFEIIDFKEISNTALKHSFLRKNKQCSKNCLECDKQCEASSKVNLNVELNVYPKGAKSFLCNVAITALDNDPEQIEDVNFILFFKCQEITPNRERRSIKRT